jgi:hypothetical protein
MKNTNTTVNTTANTTANTNKAAEYIKACGVDVKFNIEEVLDVREIAVCALRAEDKTYREIGQLIGLSHERVRKLTEKAVSKVKYHPIMMERAAEQAAIETICGLRNKAALAAVRHEDPSTWKDISVDELNLSARAHHSLIRAGFFNVIDITTNLNGVHRTRGVGKTVWLELLDSLDAFFGIEYYKENFAKI